MLALRRVSVLPAIVALVACSGSKPDTAATSAPQTETPSSVTAAVAPQPTASAEASTKPNGKGYMAQEGTRFAFHGEFRGKPQDLELELRAANAGGERLFYFVDVTARGGMVAPTFGMGAFALRADGMYTADVLLAADVSKIPPAKLGLLVALPPKVGTKAEVSSPAAGIVPAKSERYEVAAIEAVTVPAGTFTDCVKLVIATEIDGERESSTVWLAPGVGPVKLARATGRVDELTKIIPAKADAGSRN